MTPSEADAKIRKLLRHARGQTEHPHEAENCRKLAAQIARKYGRDLAAIEARLDDTPPEPGEEGMTDEEFDELVRNIGMVVEGFLGLLKLGPRLPRTVPGIHAGAQNVRKTAGRRMRSRRGRPPPKPEEP